MRDRAEVLRSLIGKPYAASAGGPDAYDCAGLATIVWRNVFGWRLPAREHTAVVRRTWLQLPKPTDGCIVMMREEDAHVGVWLQRECGVIHSLDPHGVVFDSPFALQARGFARARYYAPADVREYAL